MESEVSAGGAAQLVVPQRARGCAAAYFASWQCAHAKRHLTPSLAAGRSPVINGPVINGPVINGPVINGPFTNSPFTNSLARLPRRHPPCCVAAVPARRAMHKQAHARIPCAMARAVRNRPAIATRFLS
jgi:hypothetical protein